MTWAETLIRRWVPRPIRNWLRRPSQSLIRIWGDLLYLLGRHPRISPHLDWSFCVHPIAARTFRAFLKDPDQHAELDRLVASCFQGMVLFDLGAHFGLFSLAALRYGGPAARVVAVEPSDSAVRVLRIHARLNQATDRITIVQAAAAPAPGWQVMLPVGVIADGYYIEPDGQHPASDLVRVRAVTVDGLVRELGVTPTHLKIDVEGAEADVLSGAREILSGGDPPLVFLELHNDICRRAGRDPADALTHLCLQGYQLETSDGAVVDVTQATAPPLIRLVARRPSLQLQAS